MADTQLTTGANSGGTQAATQTPQSATGSDSGTPASGVQPGTTSNLLESSAGNGGVQLSPTSLPTVQLGATSSGTTSNGRLPAQHHTSPALYILPAVLFVLALMAVWWVARSAKTTTHY